MTQSDKSGAPASSRPIAATEESTQDAYGNALPEGITSRLVREYTVGPYRYTDLEQAIAERDRQRLNRPA